MVQRPGWDEYFLGVARSVGARGDCSRRQVGCVLVKNNRIVATGYNGTLAGERGCLAGGCPRAGSDAAPGVDYEGTGCIALHAEMNAVAYASRTDTEGGTAYITEEPCYMCNKCLAAAGIVRTVWSGESLSQAS